MAAKSTIFERAKLVLSTIFKSEVPNDENEIKKSDFAKTAEVPSNKKLDSKTELRTKTEFFRRVNTFNNVNWFGKPQHLSPLMCARYGWENVDKDLLHCVSCKVYLSGQLPNMMNVNHYNDCVKKLESDLVFKHQKHCSWRVHPSPEHHLEIDLSDRKECLNDFKERVNKLIQLGQSLPVADLTNFLTKSDVEKLAKLIPSADDDKPDDILMKLLVIGTACKIALCGWTICSKDVLLCTYCQRKIGTWNFKSLKQATAADSQNSVSEEDAEPSKKKLKIDEKAQIFQPVSQHKSWCSWGISPYLTSTNEDKKDESESSSSPIIDGSPTKDSKNLPGWKRMLHTLVPSTMPGYQSPSERMLGDPKTTPTHEGLRNVRKILNAISPSAKPSEQQKLSFVSPEKSEQTT